MELRSISTFIKAAELQSFSKAAEQLGYSQSAVTVQIKALEKELGVLLFERIGKKVRLTSAGKRFWESSMKIVKELEIARNSLGKADEIRGPLRIATTESILISMLPPVFRQIRQQCSDVQISVRTGTISELFEMVRQNDIDLLFFLDNKVNFPEWNKVLEWEEPIVFVASAENALASKTNISIERILQEPFLLTEKSISYRFNLEQMLAEQNKSVEPFLETGNTDVIAQLLLQNVGISFLPEFVVRRYVEEGLLKVLDVDHPSISMWCQLVYHKNKLVTPQMELFMDIIHSQELHKS